ncbi:hypothetical protein [Peptoniphilus obesi]|uniref:hypothetical protein n=1 Tax=Peptoniphilus obesi TaxID=1472765 RepID=UPI0004B72C85|nr:hypothetical protein [Peptoniphilus obesi]
MREDSGNFRFYNANPRGLVTAADCVFRSVSLAFDISWEEAFLELTELAMEIKDSPNSYRVLEKYLENKGYKKEKQLRKTNGKKYRLYEFAEKFPEGTYLVRMTRHISVLKDGYIYDTWDCRPLIAGNYWKIK